METWNAVKGEWLGRRLELMPPEIVQEKGLRHEQLVKLRQALSDRFDDEELRTLCFDLDVDFGDLRGEGKAAKVRELVTYLERRHRVFELVEVARRMRKDIPWQGIFETA